MKDPDPDSPKKTGFGFNEYRTGIHPKHIYLPLFSVFCFPSPRQFFSQFFLSFSTDSVFRLPYGKVVSAPREGTLEQ
jgi:hypothetical protein